MFGANTEWFRIFGMGSSGLEYRQRACDCRGGKIVAASTLLTFLGLKRQSKCGGRTTTHLHGEICLFYVYEAYSVSWWLRTKCFVRTIKVSLRLPLGHSTYLIYSTISTYLLTTLR